MHTSGVLFIGLMHLALTATKVVMPESYATASYLMSVLVVAVALPVVLTATSATAKDVAVSEVRRILQREAAGISRFVSYVTHEARNPINAASLAAEEAADELAGAAETLELASALPSGGTIFEAVRSVVSGLRAARSVLSDTLGLQRATYMREGSLSREWSSLGQLMEPVRSQYARKQRGLGATLAAAAAAGGGGVMDVLSATAAASGPGGSHGGGAALGLGSVRSGGASSRPSPSLRFGDGITSARSAAQSSKSHVVVTVASANLPETMPTIGPGGSTVDRSVQWEVLADPTAFAQIVGNFCSNAVKFADSAVTAKVSLFACPDQALADDGPGVPLAERGRLFAAYQQLSVGGAAARLKGTGLGLALCRELATLMGGSVFCRDRADGQGGAEFVLALPVKVRAVVEHDGAPDDGPAYNVRGRAGGAAFGEEGSGGSGKRGAHAAPASGGWLEADRGGWHTDHNPSGRAGGITSQPGASGDAGDLADSGGPKRQLSVQSTGRRGRVAHVSGKKLRLPDTAGHLQVSGESYALPCPDVPTPDSATAAMNATAMHSSGWVAEARHAKAAGGRGLSKLSPEDRATRGLDPPLRSEGQQEATPHALGSAGASSADATKAETPSRHTSRKAWPGLSAELDASGNAVGAARYPTAAPAPAPAGGGPGGQARAAHDDPSESAKSDGVASAADVDETQHPGCAIGGSGVIDGREDRIR
ncbi:hypothetical protein FNF29_05893 [Cafeteria roenbergensis]|uniref:histidine kinase n=1 Tax=Cafeteria roenbergensis TaxID=33653 RepID=A0A5A8CA22_CAFRO|nr:hypothetical protein FNF29_05893 [Cafeteria roenbergensis]|eukprot:KAA0149507.1 hypothetical protein FNF29_05893 [Cafeteria roenbergensis]